MEYRDKVAVISGGASGIGRALAQKCLDLGMKVVLADINPSDLEQTAQALASQGQVLPIQTDVSNLEQVQALAEAVFERFGAVHLLFNNAGVSDARPLWESTPADLDWVLGVNVKGIVYAIQNFVPRMMAQQEGWVINTASLAGLVSGSGFGLYRASKHAVVSLSETLHHELRLAGSALKVAVLCPAWVRTRIVESKRNRPSGPVSTSANPIEQVMHRVVQAGIEPEQVAGMVFAAIEAGTFYILTHPQMNPAISVRHKDIESQSPPRDTFAKAYLS